ncbi:MAG: PTS fructose transporter subunit IIC [Cellulomonadaceae bacterium]
MRFVAVTSCPTGVAHTYMAAEALEVAGRAAGHDVTVETQGAAGTDLLDPALIDAADGVIFAAELEVRDRARFAGKPTIEVGVQRGVHDAPGVIAQAVVAVERAAAVEGTAAVDAPAASPGLASAGGTVSSGVRVRQWLMTGVSHMVPFVAAGGILKALGYMLGGWDIDQVPLPLLLDGFDPASTASWAALSHQTGEVAFALLIPILAGFIAYAIADRPGLVPGFVGGALSSLVGAGFLGGIVAGLVAGFLALWLSRWAVPRGVRGVMPVVVVPLLSTAVTAVVMIVVLGRPLTAAMAGLNSWLEGMDGTHLVLLGLLLGAMTGLDLGGPVNKTAYAFAVTGLSTAGLAEGATQLRVMAAVMGAGMVAPLGMALATTLRRRLFTRVERESGRAAWLLGASFISEGALPFAAADPVRVIAACVAGSATTGALVMAFGVNLRAPHGGVWVIGLMSRPLLFLLAVAIGASLTALVVLVLKQLGRHPVVEAPSAEDDPAGAATTA